MRALVLMSFVTALALTGCASPSPTGTRIGACAHPAPVLGKYDARAPDYIVEFQPAVEVLDETARLAAKYNLVPRYIFTAAFRGFVADFPVATLSMLVCEPSVKSVSHDGLVHAAGETLSQTR